jgi:XTP/dITP diphosphohydrolase
VRRVVIATHNAKKAGEMATILGRALPGWEFVTLADYPGAPEPEETAADYEGNAVIKAESACAFTGEWCLADDAGLEIDALPGELGVHSKRFGGAELPFEAKMARVLAALEDVPEERRGARFVCWVALARPGTEVETFSATCEGRIAWSMSGAGGFGYDPIFWLPERGCTMASLSADEKHAVSHRGKVLAQVVARLAELA